MSLRCPPNKATAHSLPYREPAGSRLLVFLIPKSATPATQPRYPSSPMTTTPAAPHAAPTAPAKNPPPDARPEHDAHLAHRAGIAGGRAQLHGVKHKRIGGQGGEAGQGRRPARGAQFAP